MADGVSLFKAERGWKILWQTKAYLLEFVLIIVVGTNLLSRKIKKKAYRAYLGFYQLESKGVLKMVFCYQNYSDLLWEFFLKFEAEGREFAKILRSVEQFITAAKGENNIGNWMLF